MSIIDSNIYINDIKTISHNIDFSKFKNSSFLITGASGLIGSFLVDLLMYRNEYYNDNIKIYMLERNEQKLKNRFNYYKLQKIGNKDNVGNLFYIIQDVCNEFLFDIQFDYIIHAASNTHPKLYSTDPVGTIITNVIGLNNILKYSIKNKPRRILMMSSVEIYGENRGDVESFNESYLGYIDCNTSRAGYPESKRVGEALCQSYIQQYNLDIVIGRLSRVYGPTLLKDDSKALSQFIKNAVNNEDIVLKSEGNQLFSYTYMADAISAILTILLKGNKGDAYNIADSKSNIRLKELANMLADINGKKVVFELPDNIEKKGYSTVTKAMLDSTKINKLGWKAQYNINEGLMNTVNIMREINNIKK